MSDKEFWESTPAKIFALLDYHAKVEAPPSTNKNGIPKGLSNKDIPKMTLADFKAWSR